MALRPGPRVFPPVRQTFSYHTVKVVTSPVGTITVLYLSLAVVLNLGQVIGKLLHTPLQIRRFCVCVRANLSNQEIRFVP